MTITIELPSGERVSVDKDVVVLGRDPTCDVRLPDHAEVAARHARIRKVAARWLIESLGDSLLQIGDEGPVRTGWLRPGSLVRLSAGGPAIVFEPVAPQPKPPAPRSDAGATAPQWYYARGPERHGPITFEQLKSLQRGGRLAPIDLVWTDGMADWAEARAVPGLLSTASGDPKPPSPGDLDPPWSRSAVGEPSPRAGAALAAPASLLPIFGWSLGVVVIASLAWKAAGVPLKDQATALKGAAETAVLGVDPRVEMLAFKDDVTAFKGKTITGEMQYEGPGGMLGDELHRWPVEFMKAPFIVFTSAGVFELRLIIPRGLAAPNAGLSEPLLVTFRCTEGRIDSGNVVESIRRK